MTNHDNEFVSKYLNMLGLEYSPIIKIDDILGIVSRKDLIIGYSEKKGKEVTIDLNDHDINNDCAYKKIKFKQLRDDSIEGVVTKICKEKEYKINYTMNEKDESHTLEINEHNNMVQLSFNKESISCVYNNISYCCQIDNLYGYSRIDRDTIMLILDFYYNMVPSLLMNILEKYETTYSDFILNIKEQFEIKEQEKIKQLII